MDANNGGSGVDYPETLAKAYATIKNVDTIINGHMPAPTTPADLKEYEEYVRDFVTYTQSTDEGGQERRRRRGRIQSAGSLQGLHGGASAREI